MRLFGIAAILVLVFGGSQVARAADGVACVKAKCESPGRDCVAGAANAASACMKAARQVCDKVAIAEKANCLKSGLMPCATERNHAMDACEAGVKTCYAACNAADSKRADFWCYGESGGKPHAEFCAGEPGKPAGEQSSACLGRLQPDGAGQGSAVWTCNSL